MNTPSLALPAISTRTMLITLVVALVGLILLSFISPQRSPFASSEVQFTDPSAHGLAIVPASCPSSPHYAGDCTDVVGGGGGGGGGSGGGVCVPTNACLYGNVINSCTGAVIQVCAYGCSEGCLPPPPPAIVGFIGISRKTASGNTAPATFTSSGDLQARPALVRNGDTTQLYWNVTNVASCSITGTNGDSWSTFYSGAAGQTSGIITGKVTYTLLCAALPGATPTSLTGTAVVTVAPVYQEQ